jgi:hypothetical protein
MEVCQAGGICAEGAPPCADDGLDCTVCDEASRTCNVLSPEACAIEGTCVDAGAANPEHACQVCDPALDPYAFTPLADGSPCEDGLFCNQGEVCQAGVCGGGAARDCDDGLECTANACSEELGECTTDLLDGWCLLDGACATGESCEDVPAADDPPDPNGDLVGGCSSTGTHFPGGLLLVLVVLWRVRRSARAARKTA